MHTYVYTVYISKFCRSEITKYTVIYGVYVRFWPTLYIDPSLCIACILEIKLCIAICALPPIQLATLSPINSL